MRGYYGIAFYRPKTPENAGAILRSGFLYGASFFAAIGIRFGRYSTNTVKAERHIPFYEYEDLDQFLDSIPVGCELIGVEMDADSKPLSTFEHPQRAIYLVGSEDHGLPSYVIEACDDIIQIECPHKTSMNVSHAVTLTLYDRYIKTR